MNGFVFIWLILIAFCLASEVSADVNSGKQNRALAPGYRPLNYAAPVPGSYALPDLGLAGDGEVVDSIGQNTRLYTLMERNGKPGKIVLLSFIYTTCSDINGCPLATAVFQKIKNRLLQEPDIAHQLRLITLSFNPEHDTPAKMREYGATLQSQEIDWRFLTTQSEQQLTPILQAYRQSVAKVFDAQGRFTNTFNHSLRVYLIDRQQRIRNIYNTELLHPDMVMADVKTLMLEAEQQAKSRVNSTYQRKNTPINNNKVSPSLYSAGDNKQNYESNAYQTQSVALAQRQGKEADLLRTVKQPPLGLPAIPVPQNNPITAEKVALGRKLFYDRRLSFNNTFSCAMCHIPEQGFTSNEMATAVGVEGRTGNRNSPTLYNVAYAQSLFHDGRETALEQQIWGPLLEDNEMANPSVGQIIEKIEHSPDYNGLFEQAFQEPIDIKNIGMAIASYERTLNSANSPFDRWYYANDETVINDKAKAGFALFTGKAGCSQCHLINDKYALFSDNRFHNTGIGYSALIADKVPPKTQRVQLAPGVFVDAPTALIASVSAEKANDLGRYAITQNPKDRWLYKTPALRNIGLTAPYMHNGSLSTLTDVIEFYNRGGIANENLDPLIKPLRLNKQEINELETFLESLTGDNIGELVSDAFAAPIGDN